MTSPEPKRASIRFAIVMATVAVLGAVAAYCAARAEQNSLGAERRLEQGKILELARREELLRLRSYAGRYEERNQLLEAELKYLRGVRDGLSTDDSTLPLLHIEIQERSAIQRAFRPLLRFFSTAAGASEDGLKKDAAEELRGYGFDTVWVESPPAGQTRPSIWQRLEERVEEEHHKVRSLSFGVLLFVLALATFTFAQLNHAKPRVEQLLARGGYALAIVAWAIVLWVDHDAWKTYLLSGVGFAVLAPIGWGLARYFRLAPAVNHSEIAHPGEVEPKGFAGIRMHVPHAADRMSRFTIGMIAVTAVLSAGSGYLYSFAATAASTSGTNALEHQAELFRNTARVGIDLYDRVVQLGLLSEDRLRMDAAAQRVALAQEAPNLMDVRDAKDRLAAANRQAEARRAPKLEEVFAGKLGPYNDPGFPRQFVYGTLVRETARGYALWDASSESSLRSQRHATVYLGMLTLFAVALYLFGQALSLGTTRAAFILVFVSCCLVMAGLVAPAVTALGSLPRGRSAPESACGPGRGENGTPAVEAARRYAEGRTLYALGEYAEAAREFQCAVAARPTFALANYFFSIATSSAATPQANEGGYISIISWNVLDQVRQAQDDALASVREQGFLPPRSLQANSGFDSFLVALSKKDRGVLQQSIAATREAIRLNDQSPVTQFNLGVALLAAGESGADQAFSRGLELKPSGPVIGGAITDLNILNQHCDQVNETAYCSKLRPQIRQIQFDMVAKVWAPKSKAATATATATTIDNLSLWTAPAGLGWEADVRNLGETEFVVVWYAFDPDWKVWRVLPAISGPIRESIRQAAGEKSHAVDFSRFLIATTVPDCVRDGSYRAEFYLNGKWVKTSADVQARHGRFSPAALGDMNLALCHPPDWKPATGLVTGLVRGYTDGQTATRRGAYLFTYFSPFGSGDAARGRLGYFIYRAAAQLLAGRRVEFRRIQTCGSYRGNIGDLMAESTDGLGIILARAWIRSDGLVHVGLVIDERLDARSSVEKARAQDPAGEDCATLVSMTNR